MVGKIKELCSDRGISLAELAKSIGVERSGIYKLDKYAPSTATSVAIARFFGVNVEDLFDGNEEWTK